MKEAFEVMGTHWGVTLFLGLIIISVFNALAQVVYYITKKK